METWKEIPGTNGRLAVSDRGRVKSFLRNKQEGAILKATTDKKGYLRLRVTLDREKLSYKVHRLVAEAFVPNPGCKPQVNHKDGNKKNNSADNLEWVTNAENASHAMGRGLWDGVLEASRKVNQARMTPVVAENAKTGETIAFESVSAAERHFNSRHVSDVLNGKREKAAGCYFRRG